jgi:hypothetical protein
MRPAPLIASLLALILAAPSAMADCRLALVLAMDVSRSVDAKDFALQTEGLAAALEDKAVQAAFFGPAGDVALTAFQWSGENHQEVLVDWVIVRGPNDLAPISAAIRKVRRPEVQQLTALGAALDFGRHRLDEGPDCARSVIDMAGDGQNNRGPAPMTVHEWHDWQGITVNALAVGEHEMGLVHYFESQLILGPGAFVELAERHTDFPATIRRKLIRELSDELSEGRENPTRFLLHDS